LAHTVTVWGKPYTVSLNQSSKAVWIAAGDYMGHQIEAKDSSAGAALMRWREAAQYRGNA
jgi:hypothetical protein